MSYLTPVILLTTTCALLTASLAEEISFNFQIRPILSKNCIGCHGPDPGDRKADLRLDTFEGATSTAEGEASAIPGDPDGSLLIQRVETDDPDDVMPPPDHGHSLSEEEISLLRQWITEGAEYETHWSFVPPSLPALPEVAKSEWGQSDIDRFVLSKLQEKNLSPSEPAPAVEMLRRLSLDLTGLPPTQEEMTTFSEAYASAPQQAVAGAADRLLASPAYGEHWASMWMDLARYADTVGYSGDEHRDIWPWRDWVIKAYNDNVPYDQFLVEQIAGDLLPDATDQQRLATAFHRLTLSNNEGGTNDEEFRTIAVKDRLSTTVNSTMGLTIRCAECHTHKYDPITHQEYYEFYAFFNQTKDTDHRDDRPRMDVEPMGREHEKEELRSQIARIEQEALEKSPWKTLPLDNSSATDGVQFEPQEDGSLLAVGNNAEYPTYTLRAPAPLNATSALRLEVIPDIRHNDHVGRAPEGAFILSQVKLYLLTPDGKRTLQKISKAAADHAQPNYNIENVIDDKPHKNGWAVNHRQEGYKVRRTAVFSLAKPIQAPKGSILETELVFKGQWPRLTAGRVRLSATEVTDAATLFKQKKLDPLGRQLAQLKQKLHSPLRVPVMVELPTDKQRKTHIMTRGSFLQPGEEVSPTIPQTYGSMPEGAPQNRLGVAQWIISKENPLTARVAVNRYWARLFGIGIVETEEDLGTQGSLPSHPELLDWLAVTFMEQDWDQKKLLKTLVMTSAYQQASTATPEKLELDPRNLLLSRGPRFRLTAEVVRDQALAVSGLLDRTLYGPPVYPPSPIKTFTNAFSGNTAWVESKGRDRYRRALYTYLKRSNPHPLFDTFDMASRDVCVMRRFRTNTPLQSFMTLNDVVFVEASQALARKMTAHSEDLNEQIREGYRLVLLDEVESAKVDALAQLYQDTFAEYEANPEEALELAGTVPTPANPENAAQLASLTVVANVLLNLDAFLCK
ncbi:MAG: PSD1 and planctomycete cytochrome C domain-containing protein [Roseibacillus sp.]